MDNKKGFSTHDEIIEKLKEWKHENFEDEKGNNHFEEHLKKYDLPSNVDELLISFAEKTLSLKEQEVSKKIIDKMNERWGKDKLFMANLGKRIHELKLQLSEKDKLLSSLQEKIENFEDFIKVNLILTDIKDDKGNKIELSDELMKLFEIFTEQFIFPKFREIFQEKKT